MDMDETYHSTHHREAYKRGRHDCLQDRCENIPFASIGGLEARDNPVAPKYVHGDAVSAYLQGYKDQASEMFGADWRTCEFNWQPALTIDPNEKRNVEGEAVEAITPEAARLANDIARGLVDLIRCIQREQGDDQTSTDR